MKFANLSCMSPYHPSLFLTIFYSVFNYEKLERNLESPYTFVTLKDTYLSKVCKIEFKSKLLTCMHIPLKRVIRFYGLWPELKWDELISTGLFLCQVIVDFPLDEDSNVSMIAWTTTPWTLPSNLALVVNPDMDYVKVTGNVNVSTVCCVM